LSHLDPIFFSV